MRDDDPGGWANVCGQAAVPPGPKQPHYDSEPMEMPGGAEGVPPAQGIRRFVIGSEPRPYTVRMSSMQDIQCCINGLPVARGSISVL